VDLDYGEEAEAFRLEVRAFLEENLPAGWGTPRCKMSDEESEHFARDWLKKLSAARFLCPTWPPEYGGRGLGLLESVVLEEEFARAGAPVRADFFGETLVGPTILAWGSEEQKRFFLPKIRSGEMSWCQGFSEPEAGSDLASLRTRAELSGEEWVINGEKVWTSGAQHADYMFLLARTDPEAERHAGISFLLVPMAQPGVEVRPIAQIDGSAEFNEVFFSDARCPRENVVGGVNNGWTVAMTTLGLERGTSFVTGHRRFRGELERIVSAARRNGRIADPLVRQGLARAFEKVQILEVNGWRTLTAALRGDPSALALQATNKMFWSEYHRDVMELYVDLMGAEGQVLGDPQEEPPDMVLGMARRARRPDYPVSELQASYFFSRSETIWGGTAQIQRNIVGERVLGLPREPRAVPDRPATSSP
jgi:alkylation response protein AidB-like acyl-CoA dehydrogenase